MKRFASMFSALDETNKTAEKVAALKAYFAVAPAADAAWAAYFLLGNKPRQVVPVRRLAEWSAEAGGAPAWLFEECYHAVGDLAETTALILPPAGRLSEAPLRHWVEERLLPLRTLPEPEQKAAVLAAWDELDATQRFVFNKLITGGFRVGVSRQLAIRALSQVADLPATVVAHRLMGEWSPTAEFYRQLMATDASAAPVSRPYPFYLAHPLPASPATLGELTEWQCEWKWDGIRAQLIRRAGETFLWSRGEELVTERYSDLAAAARCLPDGTVLDGEILPWKAGVLPFAQLQRRIGRKTLGKKLLEEVPAVLMAYDLLEQDRADVRPLPLYERRRALEETVAAVGHERLLLSPTIDANSWEELTELWQSSRGRGVEGMMLKRRLSSYGTGRQRGDWWKWKIDPYSIDAVLIYAQRGNGKRASLYTDYTFGLWHEGRLVPVAKAYSGLTDEEIRQVDAFVREHTVEKFGPVRTVTPQLVFELGFEGIQRSSRHKSGVAVRFPRMLRWRTDKQPQDADSLDALLRLLPETP